MLGEISVTLSPENQCKLISADPKGIVIIQMQIQMQMQMQMQIQIYNTNFPKIPPEFSDGSPS